MIKVEVVDRRVEVEELRILVAVVPRTLVVLLTPVVVARRTLVLAEVVVAAELIHPLAEEYTSPQVADSSHQSIALRRSVVQVLAVSLEELDLDQASFTRPRA